MEKYNIDTSKWGTGSAKKITDLYKEILEGETILQDNNGKLERAVVVLYILVVSNGKILIENEQILPDRRIRSRNLPLAEKIKPRESWIDATIRGINEELAILGDSSEDNNIKIKVTFNKELNITINKESYKYIVPKSGVLSSSYPNLLSYYYYHIVEVNIDGIPATDFLSYEKKENGYMIAKWKWFDVETAKKMNGTIRDYYLY